MAFSGMPPMLSMLHSTCRERLLRPLNPEEGKEEISFICPTRTVGDTTDKWTLEMPEWKSFQGLNTLTPPVDITPPVARSKVPNMTGVGTGVGDNNWVTMLEGPISLNAQNALYVRVVWWFPIHMRSPWAAPQYPIVYIEGPSGEMKFSMKVLYRDGQTPAPTSSYYPDDSTVVCEWVDTDGVSRSLQHKVQYPTVEPPNTRNHWIDTRVYIPATGDATMTSVTYPEGDFYISTNTPSAGYSGDPVQTLKLFSFDGTPASKSSTSYNRVALGSNPGTPTI